MLTALLAAEQQVSLEGLSGGFTLVSGNYLLPPSCAYHMSISRLNFEIIKFRRDTSKSVYGMRKFVAGFANMLLLLYDGIGYFEIL